MLCISILAPLHQREQQKTTYYNAGVSKPVNTQVLPSRSEGAQPGVSMNRQCPSAITISSFMSHFAHHSPASVTSKPVTEPNVVPMYATPNRSVVASEEQESIRSEQLTDIADMTEESVVPISKVETMKTNTKYAEDSKVAWCPFL